MPDTSLRLTPRNGNASRPLDQHGSRTHETAIRVTSVPLTFTTENMWCAFHDVGDIIYIEIFDKLRNAKSLVGKVIFSTVHKPFILTQRLHCVQLSDHGNRRIRLFLEVERTQAPVFNTPTAGRAGTQRIQLNAALLSFGTQVGPQQFKALETISRSKTLPIVVTHDIKSRELSITFPLPCAGKGDYQYKIAIPDTNAQSIWELHTANNGSSFVTLIFAVQHVPEVFIKHDDSHTMIPGERIWSVRQAWSRKTDIPKDVHYVVESPTALQRQSSRINIGRWRMFAPTFDANDEEAMVVYHLLCDRFAEFNITIKRSSELDLSHCITDPIWTVINDQSGGNLQSSHILAQLHDDSHVYLSFPVRYQLEVCISWNYLNEYTITRDFVTALRDMPPNRAVSLLEAIATDGKQVFDCMSTLKPGCYAISTRPKKLASDFTWIYSAVVTPTTVHFNTPAVEISNRVIRQFSQYHDRFLRVKFEDERPRGKVFSKPVDLRGRTTMDEVYGRIRDTLTYGIDIGDRHYDFLGFGNSQFRENGAWFFAANDYCSAATIRTWMGDFSDIRSVSKHAARIGQCFTTTRPIRGAVAHVSEIDDIFSEDGKHCFTDGVGIITRPMAQLAALETDMIKIHGEPPSVIQFRAGGSKGVLAIHKDFATSEQNKRLSILIRPSQYKFHSRIERLEIIRWSQFSAAHLNKQIICVLSALGVPDAVFVSMMKQQLATLNLAMQDGVVAVRLLQHEVDLNQTSLSIASMILDGFMEDQEPFVMSLLQLWRAWTIRFLKKNAKIVVKAGASLFGCVDEYRVLRGHKKAVPPHLQSTRANEPSELPEVFVQLSKGANGRPQVITQQMVVARNPSLHPGDVRVVQGVDKPQLRHLKDCIVFPQTGDRDIPSMCSGGDLDGDEFLIIWDTDLLPPEKNYEAMDFTPKPELRLERDVKIADIIEFFVTYMMNDSLGKIANTHLAHADKELNGVKSKKCIHLADLHSQAVDYPKSGRAVKMAPELHVKVYPHFMNFEGNKRTYHSKKVCGKLYDLVELVKFTPSIGAGLNKRIQGKITIPEDTLKAAAEVKGKYDASLRRIMAQYMISTEEEVWSTFVLRSIVVGTDYKLGEVVGEISAALKQTYREECYRVAGSREDDVFVPFVAAMYQVTCNEVEQYNQLNAAEEARSEPRPLVSFPWLFNTTLGRIANAEDPATIMKPALRNTYAEAMTGEAGVSVPGTHDLEAAPNTTQTRPDHDQRVENTPEPVPRDYALGNCTEEVRSKSLVIDEVSSKASETTRESYERSSEDDVEIEVILDHDVDTSLLQKLGDL